MATRWIGILVIMAVAVAWLTVILSGEPQLPISAANGSYSNSCCGTITLRDGTLSLEGAQRINYTVKQDKAGPYVIPGAYIGVAGRGGFRVANDTPVKLRLDEVANPHWIELTDGRSIYAFAKPMPPQANLRHCMILQARVLAKDKNRRPSFDEAMTFAAHCDQSNVRPEEVNTLSCAFSQQWIRCDRLPPTD